MSCRALSPAPSQEVPQTGPTLGSSAFRTPEDDPYGAVPYARAYFAAQAAGVPLESASDRQPSTQGDGGKDGRANRTRTPEPEQEPSDPSAPTLVSATHGDVRATANCAKNAL